MLTKFPLLLRFCSKLLYELLPATIASVIGGLLFSHYANPPVATAAAAITAPANAEMIQMVRDDRALFIDYLTRYERHQADIVAEKETKRINAASLAATLTPRKPRTAETRALDATAHGKQSVVLTQPLQLHPEASASTQLQHVTQLVATPAMREIPRGPSGDSGMMVKLGAVMHSAAKWFSDGAPPRPPAPLLERIYTSAGT